VTMSKLPQTPGVKHVIELALEEVRSLQHNYVGTEHVLLGLIREEEGVAAQVLKNLGLKLEGVRIEILNLHGESGEPSEAGSASTSSFPSPARRFGRWLRSWFVGTR
jgi:ATP-dependent Clp protease ATP-binding subunit ClpC